MRECFGGGYLGGKSLAVPVTHDGDASCKKTLLGVFSSSETWPVSTRDFARRGVGFTGLDNFCAKVTLLTAGLDAHYCMIDMNNLAV